MPTSVPLAVDDLPAARGEPAIVGVALALLVPPPDGGDVLNHGGLVQLKAELTVRARGSPQADGGHAAGQPSDAIRS
jgi:hypothetical protein